MAAVIAYVHGPDVVYWDEYAHWGQMVKEIIRLDYFYTSESSTLLYHNDYPPAAPLWEALNCILSGGFDGRFVYASLWNLQLACFLPIFDYVSWKRDQWPSFFIKMALAIVSIILFSVVMVPCFDGGAASFWLSFYPDTLLALLFGLGIYITIRLRQARNEGEMVISLAGAAIINAYLLLLKQSALFFSAIILLVAIGVLISMRHRFVSNWKMLFLFGMVGFSCLLAYGSWKWVLAISDVSGGQFSLTISNCFNLPLILAGEAGEEYQQASTVIFLKALVSRGLIAYAPVSLPYFQICLSIVAITGILAYIWKDKALGILAVVEIISAAGYALLMMLMYAFSFNQVDAVNLASYERYMNTCVAGIAAALFLMLISRILDSPSKGWLKGLSFVAGSLLVFALVCPAALSQFVYTGGFPAGTTCKEDALFLNEKVPQGKTVFVINEGANAAETLLIGYYCDGVEVSREVEGYVSNADPYWSVDRGTLIGLLSDEDYLFVKNIGEEFRERYGDLFSNQLCNGTLYRIEHATDDSVEVAAVATM